MLQYFDPDTSGLNPNIDYGTPPSNSETLVSLSIDGTDIAVPEGTSVLRAATLAGINIPKLYRLLQMNHSLLSTLPISSFP